MIAAVEKTDGLGRLLVSVTDSVVEYEDGRIMSYGRTIFVESQQTIPWVRLIEHRRFGA